MIQSLRHSEEVNRRFHTRLHLSGRTHAIIRIVKVDGSEVDLLPGMIQLLNVSPGGCGFRSGLRFPVNSNVMYRMEWESEGERLCLNGKIRWREAEENGFRYGLRFLPTIQERLVLVGVLNRLVLRTCPGQHRIHYLYRLQIGADRSFAAVRRKWK